ncbi:MAG: isopentenyl-diphosphate delta-isomerase [Candidatus Pacearchaeota archaeon]|nr:isopentenyl-diphosphate delta-isomerase [Candidatus Pacearchaeota archaeon]
MDKIVKIINDEELPEDKLECHLGEGILHKAFSIWIFRAPDEVLIQKRSSDKFLWPLYWSNTCCSHPRLYESYEEGGRRRLREELGFVCDLEFLYKFEYHARFEKEGRLIGSENEVCSVLIGKYNNEIISPNKKEVSAIKWIDFTNLEINFKSYEDKYTPWFIQEFYEIKKNYINRIKELF